MIYVQLYLVIGSLIGAFNMGLFIGEMRDSEYADATHTLGIVIFILSTFLWPLMVMRNLLK